ncbi:MAG: hypothetical protein AB8B71_13900 [Paracoccaceae bacterium]
MVAKAAFTFTRPARSRATLIAIALTWAVCGAGLFWFQAAAWIIALLALFTLPALWEIWSGASAGCELDPMKLKWHSGHHTAEIALHEIDHIRMVTRLDLSIRAAIILKSGKKLRMPAEATPPAKVFEPALAAFELTVRRHHFVML